MSKANSGPGIAAIVVKGSTLVPLYNDTEITRPCYFDTKGVVIFGSLQGIQKYPAVCSTCQTFEVHFTNVEPNRYSVSAKLHMGEDKNQPLVPDTKVKAEQQTLNFNLDNKARPLALVGKIEWFFEDSKASSWTATIEMDVELYVLSASLPAYVRNFGLPLSLMRQKQLFESWMNPDITTTWENFVIDTLFKRYPIWYEVVSGAPKYTSISSNGPQSTIDNVVTWIDLWISDMNGLASRKDSNTKYAVNCYDLASLSYALITLGMANYSVIHIAYMDPFGFIKKTNLIGRGQSNNPLFTNPKDILVAENEKRRAFYCHMFLTKDNVNDPLDPLVLDACCGPHLGTKLTTYIDQAIDKDPVLYGAGHPQRFGRPGTAKDITNRPAVVALGSTLAFEIPDRGSANAEYEAVLNRMKSAFSTDRYKIERPFIGSPGSIKKIAVGTWTISLSDTDPKKAADRISVNIYRFKKDGEAFSDYERRKRAIPLVDGKVAWNEWVVDDPVNKIRGNHLVCNFNTGSLCMFHADKASLGKTYLVTVESDSMPTTKLHKEALKIHTEVIDKINIESLSISDVKGPSQPITQGDYFKIKVTSPDQIMVNSEKKKLWWRGYQVNTLNGNAVRLTSGRGASDNIAIFKFVARSSGPETITVTMYGPQLTTVEQIVDVDIQHLPVQNKF